MTLQQVLLAALNALLLAIIPIITTYVVQLLSAKTQNAKLNQYLAMVEDAAVTAVQFVSQTIVDNLKADGTFDKAEQAAAFESAKALAKKLAGEVAIKIVEQAGIDFNALISAKIESAVRDANDMIIVEE